MSDLISRQHAIDEIRFYITEPDISDDETKIEGYNDGLEMAISILSILSSAESERTAKVRDKKDDPMVDEWHQGRCMNCGKQVRRRNNYCSRCGGRLIWGDDDE